MAFFRPLLPLALLALWLALPLTSMAQSNADARALYNDGNSLMKSGDFAGAIAKYDAALALEQHPFFWYQKGLAQRNLQKESDAIDSFSHAVELDPGFAAGYNALGISHFAQNDFDKAIENYEKALALKPTLTQARSGLATALTGKAQALVRSGDADEAAPLARRAMELDRRFVPAAVVLTRAYNADKKYTDAVKTAQAALKATKGANQAGIWYELGMAQLNLGNERKAREAFMEAKKDPAYAPNAEKALRGIREGATLK